MIDIATILERKYFGTNWTLNGDDYSGLTWLSDTPKPTLEELQGLWEIVQYETEIENIQALRKTAYQNESDPIFFDFQRGEATEEEWLNAIQDIKDRYPYPVIEGES